MYMYIGPATSVCRDEASKEEWEREGSTVSDEDYQVFLSSPSPSPAHQITTPTTNENKEEKEKEKEELEKKEGEEEEEAEKEEEDNKFKLEYDVQLPTGPGEQWSPTHVDVSQFIQLCDLLLGEEEETEE